MSELPLSGIRVVEMGQLLAGPFCAQLLGDFGAEVIEAEPPGDGYPMRQWGQVKPVVDASLYESVLAVMESIVPDWEIGSYQRERTGSITPNVAPSNVYPTADGAILIGANRDTIFRWLTKAMSEPELATNPRYATQVARGENQQEFRRASLRVDHEPRVRTAPRPLIEHGIPAGWIYRVKDMLEDPHFQARESIIRLNPPGIRGLPDAERLPQAVRYAGHGSLARPQARCTTTTFTEVCRASARTRSLPLRATQSSNAALLAARGAELGLLSRSIRKERRPLWSYRRCRRTDTLSLGSSASQCETRSPRSEKLLREQVAELGRLPALAAGADRAQGVPALDYGELLADTTDHLTAHMARLRARQPGDHRAGHRRVQRIEGVGIALVHLRRAAVESGGAGRETGDASRANGVDRNPDPGQLQARRKSETHQRGLGGGIVRLAEIAEQAGTRRRVDDPS